MKRTLGVLFVMVISCAVLLIGGCGSDSKGVTTITHVLVNGTEEASILKDAQLPIVKDFRKNIHSGVGAKIVSAKAVGFTSNIMDGGLILFAAVIEINGQQHPAKLLINMHYITHGKNSDGPFVNIPNPGDSLQVICINGAYYGPLANLGF